MGATTDTRTRMVTSAALLLRERGVAGTSIARVLEHADGPRGSVQFHFPGGKAQLVTEALEWAASLVTEMLDRAAERRDPPAEVLAGICGFYADQLASTEFRAGCPVGSAAQEAYDDPALAPTITHVLDTWTSSFARVLTAAGHPQDEAADLAVLCVAAVEGAIILARTQRSTRPLELVARHLAPLL